MGSGVRGYCIGGLVEGCEGEGLMGYTGWVEGGVEDDESLGLVCRWRCGGLGCEIMWVDRLEEAECR